MTYNEFLDTVKVLKMLYGSVIAREFFENNIEKFEKPLSLDSDFAKALLTRKKVSVN